MYADADFTTVTITLTASAGDFGPRNLTLTPDSNIIPIGRASKSVNKNLLGAVDNAWFDSPVMSRTHAQMSLKSDNDESVRVTCKPAMVDLTNILSQVVSIKDLGSMHGTCLNGKRLVKNVETRVVDGDVLVFGTEVKREKDVFPACTFQANLSFAPYK
jgi:pSer/pThr/pTyr-binding forkhead associated (FHA) protein